LEVRVIRGLIVLAACGLVACGDGDSESDEPATATPKTEVRAHAAGTRITLRDSEFGQMLWGTGPQAIYIFERDEDERSRCYGACAGAWPPVFAKKGGPVAGDGVKKGLLGTTQRRGGRRQVTYAGKPLYYYAHEGRREVLCHDVFLNGGYWWAVGRDGKRRPS
jgi:predicted lipoprotein with Yx(FWY)xxD motif